MYDLTPLDVRNKIGDFRRAMRGYDPAEVDAFVELVAERMASLGIAHVHQGQARKLPVFERLIGDLGVEPDAAAYMGDDVVDLGIMTRVGLAVAVANAHPLVIAHAHWQTPSEGGRGAVRELCDLIMHAQGTLEGMHREYLSGNA